MTEQNPRDSFSRYGLAMELSNTGQLEAAAEEFFTLLRYNPNYAAGYFHGGQTLEKMGRYDEAREFYETGVEVTRRKGDSHALAEMQGALDLLG